MAKKDFRKTAAELFISSAEEEQDAPQEAPQAPQEAPQTAQEGFTIPRGYRLAKELKSERMQLLLRPALKESIRQEAAEQGLSMNDLVNNIFEEYLERKGKA